MSKTTDNSKATATPWKYNEMHGIITNDRGRRVAAISFSSNALPNAEDKANGPLIVRAVNEYEALCAVAEVAANLPKGTYAQLEIELANLAAIRKGVAQ